MCLSSIDTSVIRKSRNYSAMYLVLKKVRGIKQSFQGKKKH